MTVVKPIVPVINWDHPLAKRLKLLVTFYDAIPRAWVDGKWVEMTYNSASSDGERQITPVGPSYWCEGHQGWDIDLPSDFPGIASSRGFTMLLYGAVDELSAGYSYNGLVTLNGSVTANYLLWVNGDDGTIASHTGLPRSTGSVAANERALMGYQLDNAATQRRMILRGKIDGSLGSGNIKSGATTFRIGSRHDLALNRSWNGWVDMAYIFDGAIPEGPMIELHNRPFDIIGPSQRYYLYSGAAAGGTTDLAIADASSATEADALAITQAHSLGVAGAASAPEVDAVAVTQAHALAAAGAISNAYADAVAISQDLALTIAGAESAAEVDAVAVTQAHALTIAGAESAAEVDAVAVTQAHSLVPDGAVSNAFADAVAITLGGLSLTIAGAASAPEVDAVAVTQAHALTVAGAESAAEVDAVAVTQAHALTVAGAESASQAEAVAISQGAVIDLSVADAVAQAQAEAVAIAQAHGLVAAPAYADSEAASAAVTQAHVLAVDGPVSVSEVDSVTFFTLGTIVDPTLVSKTVRRTIRSV